MDITVFKNNEFGEIRSTEINGEPWFVGKDVAEILGYGNPRQALNTHVDDEAKGVHKFDSLGGSQDLTVINESGLYSLILGSKLPSANAFKRWFTSEILPSIHKHGMYARDKILYDPDLMITVSTELKAERERTRQLTETVAIQNQQIVKMKLKASYYDVVLNCADLVAISVIAKDYGWSANHMNRYLHEKGVQYKQGNIWLLYQQYAELGYTSTKTHSYPSNDGTIHTKVHTYWTQSGRLFIYVLLKANGILPLIEINTA